jgi:hypothetical protein
MEIKKNNPLRVNYTNTTDEVKRVSFFEIFNVNPKGVSTEISHCSMDFTKKYFYENPHLISLFRFQSTNIKNIQSEGMITKISKNPIGESVQEPAILLIDFLHKQQFQSGIVDIPYHFVLDGLTSDLEFDLLPNTTVSIAMFFSEKCDSRSDESLKSLIVKCNDLNESIKKSDYVGSIVVENKSNESKVVYLNDIFKYENEYFKDSDLILSDIFNKNTNSNEFNCGYFDSIRISSNNSLQVISPIEFNSGGKYYPAVELNGTEFQSGINDVNIVGEEFSSENTMRVTVIPNTRVLYLFKKLKHKAELNHSKSFINIESINNTETNINKKVNVLSADSEENMMIDGIYTSIGKNKMNLSENYFNPDMIRMRFFKPNQIERDITFVGLDCDGNIFTKTVNPVVYLDETLFQSGIVEFKLDFGVKVKKISKIICDFRTIGDGVNIILYNLKDNFKYDYEKSINLGIIQRERIMPIEKLNEKYGIRFPIWIENTTDKYIEVELFNNKEDYKCLPEGVNCNIYNDSNGYESLLNKFDSVEYKYLTLHTVYGKVTMLTDSKVFTCIDSEEYSHKSELGLCSYISAMQFQPNIINIPDGLKLFTLIKIDNSDKIKYKQKLVVGIEANSKIAYVCSLS